MDEPSLSRAATSQGGGAGSLPNSTSQMSFPNRFLDSLIFDLDGTLWDTMDSCAVAWNQVIHRHRIPFREISPADIRAVTGMAHEQCIRSVFHGLPEETLLSLIRETMEEDNKVIGQRGGLLYPGVREGLAQLEAKYPLFIVSNCQSGYIETFIRWSGISLFKDFECWGNTGKTKSQNLRDLVARNRLASPAFIGDTEGDATAAEDCGIPFIHVEYGFGKCSTKVFSAATFSDLVAQILASSI